MNSQHFPTQNPWNLGVIADAMTGSDGVMLKEELHFVVAHTTVWSDVFGVQKGPSI